MPADDRPGNQVVPPDRSYIICMIPKGAARGIFGITPINEPRYHPAFLPGLRVVRLVATAVAPPRELAFVKSAFAALLHDIADLARKALVRNAVEHDKADGELAVQWLTARLKVNIECETVQILGYARSSFRRETQGR